MSDNESVAMEQDTPQPGPQTQSNGQPIKIRKKPGRKPNPASPALRKAQNRAAQRAFRERKERHMRELEIAIKQIREQRDKLHVENEQFKADQEILRSENWYLKGIVLTLQLVCFQHNLVIPQHGPYINEQAISVLAQSIPEPIAAYISVNASNKLPIPSKLFGYRHTMKQRDRYLSTGSIVITKDGIHSVSDRTSKTASLSVSQDSLDRLYSSDVPTEHLVHPLEQQQHDEELATTMPPLSPGSMDSDSESPLSLPQQPSPPVSNHSPEPETHTPHPVMLAEEPLTSNLAAIQTLRLRLRLQSACVRMDSIPFAIQPTLLQLTIPHDPRIDLIPTPHMRDRMILFRDQFDLDDCFRCLLAHSVFHGGDPAIAANWQLPPEFFEKYWFLTIDYDLRRTTNKWRRLQGLGELDFKQQQKQQEEERKQVDINELHLGPMLEQYSHQQLNPTDISALLGISFGKTVSQDPKNNSSYASSLSSDSSYNTASSPSPTLRHATTVAEEEEDITPTFEPVRLTNGYNFSYSKPQPHQIKKSSGNHKSLRHHPYQQPEKEQRNSPKNTASGTCDPWDTLLVNNTSTDQQDYDFNMDHLIDTEQTC